MIQDLSPRMSRTASSAGSLFEYALLLATLLPFAAVVMPRVSPVLSLVTALSLVSGTHVMATAYLYCSRAAFRGVPNWRLTVVAAPVLLMAAVFFAVLTFPLPLLMLFMLVYLHFGVWHFGRQNLGVLTFATRISQGRPIDRFERWTIMAGVVAGVCATYTAFAPGLSLNTALFPISIAPVAPVFSRLWYVGAAIYAVLIPVVLGRVWLHREKYDLPCLLLYLASVAFFLPLFLTGDPLIAVGSWTTAHGLQYLVFLSSHAMRQSRPALSGLVPIAVFLAAAGTGYAIWMGAAQAQIEGWVGPVFMRAAAGTVLALTLAHYWVDMFLWRFRTQERRQWLTEGYPFLVSPAAADRRPIPAAAD
jgi:hypothetical protein